MAIRSDNQGFLVGELVESNKDVVAGISVNNRLLGGIKTDVSAIARALGVASRGGRSSGSSRAVAEPAGRGGSRGGEPGTRSPAGGSMPAQRSGGFGAANARATVAPGGRDGRGRFVAGSGGSGKPGGVEGAGGSRLLDKLGNVADAMKGMAGGGDQIDPSLAAMKELKDVVAPIGRGAFALLGRTGTQKKEQWYQKIWKSLTNIEKKSAGGGGGGGGGGDSGGILGGLSLSMKGILPLIGSIFTRVLGPIAALWGAFELGQWVGKKIYEWLDASGIMTKVFDAFDTMSAGISGAWTTATDGFIKALDFLKSIPDRIGGVFDAIDQGIRKIPVIGDLYAKASDATKSTAADAKKGYAEGRSGDVSAPPTSAAQAVGRDSGKVVGAVVGVGTQAKAGYDVARGKSTDAPAPSGAVQSMARGAGGVVGTGVTVAGNAGQVLKAGVAAGMGPKELANFMGQNAHESNNFTATSENLNYSAKGLRSTFGKYYKTDAEAQADAKNPEAIANKVYGGRMGNTEEGDGYKFRGRGFTQLTGKDNYAAASKDLGMDLVKNPDLAADPANAAKISAWYWKKNVSSKGAGEDVAKATKAVNGGLNGLDDRTKKTAEWETKIAGGAVSGVAAPATVTAGGAPVLAQSSVPSSVPTKLPAMPEVNIPAPSIEKDRPLAVSIRQPIGQDMGDRGIAHIVSGGMGG